MAAASLFAEIGSIVISDGLVWHCEFVSRGSVSDLTVSPVEVYLSQRCVPSVLFARIGSIDGEFGDGCFAHAAR